MRFIQKLFKKLRAYSSKHGYTCDACGKEVFSYPQERLCATCNQSLLRNDNRICDKCGRKTIAEGICLNCKKHPPAFTKGFSPFVYKGETASLINRVKNGKRRLGYFFGEAMAEYFLASYPKVTQFSIEQTETAPLLLLPVPMSEQDRKIRGYNQAVDLAEVIQEKLTKAGFRVQLGENVLLKIKNTPPQKQRSFFERRENLKGAFHVHKRTECKGRVILLIDDIMTTGATADECTERLLGAGAKEVLFLTATALPEQR